MTSRTDFTLYYWPVPFRGQFIRAILSYAGKSYDEPDDKTIAELMGKEPGKQPWPFMGPPLLIDNEDGSSLAQMPAIAFYLGEKLGLMPTSPIDRARAVKTVNDCNDVIDEMSLQGGVYRLWDEKLWKDFQPRLAKWMAIFEATGKHYGLKADSGYLLGTEEPTIADIATATLWGTMTAEFEVIAQILDREAPLMAAHMRRMYAMPNLAALAKATSKRFGRQYCGGQIEKSLRAVAK